MGNANSGRRPQPTALTVLRGNPSKKRLNEKEPIPPSGEVKRPVGLSAAAEAVWDELAPICLAMGTLTTADVRTFATLCELQSTMQIASAQKDGKNLLSLVKEGDEPELTVLIDAVLRLERDTANSLRSYYAMFGLEPSSRARLSVNREEKTSKWAGVLG